MKLSHISQAIVTITLTAGSMAGCNQGGDAGGVDISQITSAQEPQTSEASLKIEQAERMLARGQDAAEAKVLIDEALANIAPGRCLRRRGASNLGRLPLTLPTVGKQVVGIPRAHHPRPRQRQCYPRGIDGDPPAAPLLRYVGSGAGTAGRVEHKIAGIGGHMDAACDNSWVRLNDIDL